MYALSSCPSSLGGSPGLTRYLPSQSLPLSQPWLAQGKARNSLVYPVLSAFSYQWETSTGYRYYAKCARFILRRRSNPTAQKITAKAGAICFK